MVKSLSDYACTLQGLLNPHLLTEELKGEAVRCLNRAWDMEDVYSATMMADEGLHILSKTRGESLDDEIWRDEMIEALNEVKKIRELYNDGATPAVPPV